MWHANADVSAVHMTTAQSVLAQWMHTQAPVWMAHAPGRLDVMGGIADYSGSLVLQWPLDVVATAMVQARTDNTVVIVSLAAELAEHTMVTFALDQLQQTDYARVRQYLHANEQQRWAAYMAGVITILHAVAAVSFPGGVTIVIDSQVPLSKGVSSSAAIEVATMAALLAMVDRTVDGRTMALWCQQAENFIVGAPCGVMDQMASACGHANTFMALRCQPAELLPTVALPQNLAVWGIDSGVRHAVSGSDYGAVRIGAFMGYRIIADIAGLQVTPHETTVRISDPYWHGYLANMTPSEFMQHYAAKLPQHMRGAEFLMRYQGMSDTVTRVDSQTDYAVWQPTYHPISEHHRVQLFAKLLTQAPCDETTAMLLGELMYQSHASYSACGLGSDATDAIVAAVRTLGPAHGLYGAKITGGGSGGTVAVLGRPDALIQVRAIAQKHGTGLVFAGSSDGAAVRRVVHWTFHGV